MSNSKSLLSIGGALLASTLLISSPIGPQEPYRSKRNNPHVNKYAPHVGEKQRRKNRERAAKASTQRDEQ